jgi:hypothetical protein
MASWHLILVVARGGQDRGPHGGSRAGKWVELTTLWPILVFIDENGGGPGVRLRKRQLKKGKEV